MARKILRPILRPTIAILLAFGLLDVAASATPHKGRHAPAPRDIDPETTATIPARPTPPRAPEAAAKPDNATLPVPFRLPAASHARMRDCGRKWQTMKMSGEAGDDIWRDFAARCLAATNGPFQTH